MFMFKAFKSYYQKLSKANAKINNRILFVFFTCISILFGTYLIIYEGFKFIDTIYFLSVTALTVGFGDMSPSTDIGKILCIFYMIISIGTFTLVLEKVVSVGNKKLRGIIKLKNKSKLVIIGYQNEEKIKELVNQIRLENNEKVVLITNRLEKKPDWFNEYHIEFIKGHISKEDTLLRANILETEIIVMLTEDHGESSDDSISTTALHIKSLLEDHKKEDIRMIIELNKILPFYQKLLPNAVFTTIVSSEVLAQEILDEGAINFSNAIFKNDTHGTQYNIYYVGKDSTWLEIATKLTKRNCIGEAYKNSDKFCFVPQSNDIIKEGTIIKYRAKHRLKEKTID